MSITGNWAFASRSPMGNDDGTINLVADGQLLTGSITGKDGETEILDGNVDGHGATWKAQILKPMPTLTPAARCVAGLDYQDRECFLPVRPK